MKRLIDMLHRHAVEGHTFVVIEHHMDVAAEADWILGIGSESGKDAGEIVAQGTPEKVAVSNSSRTAPFLKLLRTPKHTEGLPSIHIPVW